MARFSCGLVEMSSLGFSTPSQLDTCMQRAVANHVFDMSAGMGTGYKSHSVSQGVIVLTVGRPQELITRILEDYPGWRKAVTYPGQYGNYHSTLWTFAFVMKNGKPISWEK